MKYLSYVCELNMHIDDIFFPITAQDAEQFTFHNVVPGNHHPNLVKMYCRERE